MGSRYSVASGRSLVTNAVPGYFGHIPRKYVENVYGLPFMRANAVSSSMDMLSHEDIEVVQSLIFSR